MVSDNYVCSECGAKGVKLWREYNTFADAIKLTCCDCTGKKADKDVSDIDIMGTIPAKVPPNSRTNQIGWYMPAVPVSNEEGLYHGVCSIPQIRFKWWESLPTREGHFISRE